MSEGLFISMIIRRIEICLIRIFTLGDLKSISNLKANTFRKEEKDFGEERKLK